MGVGFPLGRAACQKRERLTAPAAFPIHQE